ncbi:HAMP domain-containing protein [Rubrobacter tropicus]|uniref:histidine kinase n=1 Tax=Rubrobacter tropicus TaxID=2653851 RepID=A0A6G8Q6P6_9ACTN|nr:HAMP domain-containing sensor histidine kinase [Rubrobacter tropicus]QIN82109.1 HAMP domain-containing protein [Rubrobacter tropicus]
MPIRWRLTVYNALSIGAILLALGFASFLLLRDAALSDVEDDVRGRALAVARTVESGGELPPDEAERSSLGDEFLIVRDGRGRVLDPDWLKNSPRIRIEDPLWARALETGGPVGGEADYSPQEAPDYVYAVPVDPPEGPARVVEVGRSYGSVTETLNAFALLLVGAVLVALVLSVVGAYVLARAALAPVDAVARSARQIGAGDLGRRLPVARPGDELGRLTTTINDLLARLEASFARREEALARQRRFAADASHELRTPLTSIAGYARMLKSWGLENREAGREGVEAILEESERMRVLVEDLLVVARGDEGGMPLEPAPNDLGALAAEAVGAARAAAGGKVVVQYVPPKEPVGAVFDGARIRRAADILLDNAVKYTPEGGVVTVGVAREGGLLRLRVSDTGAGIPKEDLPRVFERFYRADPARSEGGTGLGLSIARQIARAHGGEVEAASRPGKGSTFVLSLPENGPG